MMVIPARPRRSWPRAPRACGPPDLPGRRSPSALINPGFTHRFCRRAVFREGRRLLEVDENIYVARRRGLVTSHRPEQPEAPDAETDEVLTVGRQGRHDILASRYAPRTIPSIPSALHASGPGHSGTAPSDWPDRTGKDRIDGTASRGALRSRVLRVSLLRGPARTTSERLASPGRGRSRPCSRWVRSRPLRHRRSSARGAWRGARRDL